MSHASEARRERRALKKAGVAVLDRVTIEHSALMAAADAGAKPLDMIAYHIAEALERLDERGAAIIGGKVAITIGEHPDHPNALTIEAKAASLRAPAPVEDADPGCPIDHSLDSLDD